MINRWLNHGISEGAGGVGIGLGVIGQSCDSDGTVMARNKRHQTTHDTPPKEGMDEIVTSWCSDGAVFHHSASLPMILIETPG